MSLLWMFLFLATFNLTKHSCVEELRILNKNRFRVKPKGTIKTIEALESGDIIDCVDFYKQPIVHDPHTKGLKVPNLDPSSFPSGFNKSRSHWPKLVQTWHKYGECPKGTIAIRRTMNNNMSRKKNDPNTHEYVVVHQRFNKSHGVRARLNVWNPRVELEGEMSLSQIWIISGSGQNLNTIEVGWMVNERLYNDKETRFFTYWTADNYGETGCYNTKCGGFVQTSEEIALGASLYVSEYDQEPVVHEIILERRASGDWYLMLEGHELGYFPASRFTTLQNGADEIQFGGEIVNLKNENRHSKTVMGSGRWPDEGYKKSCFISHIKVINENFQWVNPRLTTKDVTKWRCYDLTLGPAGTNLGSHFYFGGPGFSRRCP